jgi:hypothetical protein
LEPVHPLITRNTEKGLPQYNDAGESDVIILSGAKDLLPVLNGDGTRWSQTRSLAGATYRFHRYRARIEGLFARIERWTNITDPQDVHWRSISGDNMLSLYGKDASSRIADPEDSRRIFSWLLCDTRADKGNAVLYEYKAGDGAGVDPIVAHERNRGDLDGYQRKVRNLALLYGRNRFQPQSKVKGAKSWQTQKEAREKRKKRMI